MPFGAVIFFQMSTEAATMKQLVSWFLLLSAHSVLGEQIVGCVGFKALKVIKS